MNASRAIFDAPWPLLIFATLVCLASLPGCTTPPPVAVPMDLPPIPPHLATPPIPLKALPIRLSPT